MNSAMTRSACVCRGTWRRTVDRGLERVEPGRDRVRLARPDPDHLRARQPRRHQPVLGLGGLDHQPRDAARGRGLEQGPHGLRLARPGRAADEHVPVERVARQHQRPGRPQVPVQDLAQLDPGRRPAPARPLGGDVEVGAQRQPDPRHLGLRRPGQRGQQLGRPVERRGRHGVAAGLEAGTGAERRRAERVRQALQVGRRAQQPGDPGGARLVPPARRDRDSPEPGRLAALQLGVAFPEPSALGRPLGEPVGRSLGEPLPQPDLLRSARSSAGAAGSAVTSQPNGPVQLPSSPSSSDSPARPDAAGPPAGPAAPFRPAARAARR